MIIEIDRLQFDWALITSMIERWRPETHTFHLPIGEATITLEDMEVFFELLVDGIPVTYPHDLRDYRGVDYFHMLQRLISFQPAEPSALSRASRLQLTPVRQHLVAMDAEITDDSPPEDIDRHTRLLLLLIFGSILFPNTSGNLVILRFLHHVERLYDLFGYSCGTVVLVYLYRKMYRACMGTQRDVARFLPLLQRDDHYRVDQTYMAWLEAKIEVWDQRYDLIPPYPPPDRMDRH
nr:protein MAIN-LIKE 2-like [Nicotiana tomentosiformis]